MISAREQLRMIVATHPSPMGCPVSFTFLRQTEKLTHDCVGAHIGIDGNAATLREWAVRFERMAREIRETADKLDQAEERSKESHVAKALGL